MKQELNIGTLLDNGKYRVERILGQGGFGITYLVTDLGLDKFRTIKEFFPKDFCQRDETTSHISLGTFHTAALVERLKAKFIKEARNLANLDQHHGIVKIQTVFEENNTAYYVMDYIEGESLSSMVKRQGPISVDRAVRYIKQVGEALAYVHSHNINHLDVKPANIMVRRKDDKPILIDFGLAKQYDSEGHQTSTTPTGISHGFAPFEQYRDGGVMEFSPQTDIYSLAATLYYLISGKIPPNASELIESGLSFSHVFSPELQKVIRKAMSTRRQDRHETVKEFINELDSLDLTSENTSLTVSAELPQEIHGEKRTVSAGATIPEYHVDPPIEKLPAADVVNTPAYHVEPPIEELPAADVVTTPEYSNKLPQKKSNTKSVWIIAAIILLIGGIVAVFIFSNGNNTSRQRRATSYREESKEEVSQDENSDLSAVSDSLNTIAENNLINVTTPETWSPKTEAEYKAMTTDQLLDEMQAYLDYCIAEMQATHKEPSQETQALGEPLSMELESRKPTPEQEARAKEMIENLQGQMSILLADSGVSDNDISVSSLKNMSNSQLIDELEFVANQIVTKLRTNPDNGIDPKLDEYSDLLIDEIDKRDISMAEAQRYLNVVNNFQSQVTEIANSLGYD